MNKTSLQHNQTLIKAIVVFILCAFMGLQPAPLARADGAPPPDPTVGGVGPYRPQKTNVQMMSETVLIEVPPSPSNVEAPKQIKVHASFTMQNQGQTEEQMNVIFPLTRLDSAGTTVPSLYEIDISSFVARVDGKSMPISQISTPPEVTTVDLEQGFPPDVQWAAFPATFPMKKDVLLEVEYEMLNEYAEFGEGFTGIAYILETGAGWFGNILSADIILRLPYPVTDEAIKYANPGYVLSGNEMRWNLRNIEPTREDNLEVRVIHADVWKSILDLRAKTKQNPMDSDAWVKLGDEYIDLGIFMRESSIFEVNPHFTELAIEARQQAVNLLPESGDAHYNLAEILWLSHPGIKNEFRMGGESTAPEPSLDDPAVQQILHELQLAYSLGSTNELPNFSRVFPQIAMSTNGIVTVTPTVTYKIFATSTASPTIAPTTSPPTSPTPVSISIERSSPVNKNGTLFLGIIGLIIIGGMYAFIKKSK
jgi:hypothetical protein